MAKKYSVRLSEEERIELEKIVKKGRVAAYKRQDEKSSASYHVSVRTVERVRQRLVEQGLESALNRAKQKRVRSRRLDGDQEAKLIALSCSDPPEGRNRWTLTLLANKMVELEYVDSVCPETIRQTLSRLNLLSRIRLNNNRRLLRI